jgi:predicted porin
MNKKLIAAAVAAAFVVPTAASAEAVIYGSLHTSLQYTDQDTNDDDYWDTASNDGALGIKGSEDLGGGLKALYKVEFNIFPAGDSTPGSVGTQTFGDAATMDEIWVGLTGGFGTVLIGTEDTPYKTFMDSPGVDILGDSIVDVDTINNVLGADGFERFTAVGTVAYVSPNFSGFTFGAAIVPGGQFGNGPLAAPAKNNNTDIAEHYSIAGNYKAGGLVIAAGYENKVALAEDAGVNERENENWGIGASYTFGSFKVGAKYENDDNGDAASAGNTPLYDEADRYAVSGMYTFGNNEIGAVYSYEDQDGFANDDKEFTGWGLFGAHNFSNRTKVYAAYANSDLDNDDPAGSDDDADIFALGVIHSF